MFISYLNSINYFRDNDSRGRTEKELVWQPLQQQQKYYYLSCGHIVFQMHCKIFRLQDKTRASILLSYS
jgi:hypothetical protein